MNLIIIYGPMAVGKTTVGRHLAGLTGYKLLHNHVTIEPLVQIFEYDSPPFRRLNASFRLEIVREAVRSGMSGLIMTYVWDLDAPDDRAILEQWTRPIADAGGDVWYVELTAPQTVRLRREGNADRVAIKPSRSDTLRSREAIVDLDRRARLNSRPGDEPAPNVLRIDTTTVSPAGAARMIAQHLRR